MWINSLSSMGGGCDFLSPSDKRLRVETVSGKKCNDFGYFSQNYSPQIISILGELLFWFSYFH